MLPTPNGMYGIQAHHSNMITAITAGTLRYRIREDEVLEAAVSGGLVKVENGEVLILVDTAERPEDIDANRARRDADAAKEAMLQKRASWSTRRPRPRWPGRSAACGSSAATTSFKTLKKLEN